MTLWLFLRLGRWLGFRFLTMYAPAETVVAIHFARDEVAFVRSINDWNSWPSADDDVCGEAADSL